MHKALAAGKVAKDFSPRVWHGHMYEEETRLVPLMVRFGYEAAARRLLRDHALYRSELRQYGEIVSLENLDRHSDVENRISADILDRLDRGE